MIQFCNRCLYSSNHPLNLTFDEAGICSGCRVHEEKDQLDWMERGRKLSRILNSYRSKLAGNYDCIVPVSGAKDSHFIVHTIKNIYGMNPLLVTYNKQYNTKVGIRNLVNIREKFDCDIMTLTVNPELVKKITRATIRKFGSIYWHCIAGQTVYPVQLAVNLKIPLIVWGAHQGIDQVGMYSHLDEVEMTRKYRHEHDLMGYEASDLVDDFDDIQAEDVELYQYPDNIHIERVGVRGIYLNNYIRWDSRSQHEEMIKIYGYESASQTRTFDTYNDVDCWNYSDVHDYIKWLKFGYGKVVDHACRDIRLGHISRVQGIDLCRFYLNKEPKNFRMFLTWIGITDNAFHFLLDQHRSPEIWRRNGDWEWENISGLNSDNPLTGSKTNQGPVSKEFKLTELKCSTDKDNEYILIGKGTK